MITYCCDMCRKAIEEDDIEAIEVKQIEYKMLFSSKKEFKPVRKNMVNENQNHHYCGECKGDFYNLIQYIFETLCEVRERDDIKNEQFLNHVLHGDCLEWLPQIEDKSIDLIVTDPPYLHVKGGMKSKVFNREQNGTWKPNSVMNKELSDFGEKEIYRFLDDSIKKMKKVNMFVFCSKLQLQYYFSYIKEKKLKYDLLVWDKVKYSMKSTKFFTSDIEYVVRIYQNGVSLRKIFNEEGTKADIRYYLKRQSFPQPREYGHQTEKPLEMIERYIKLASDEGDTVLDCFLGSGTTAVACINTNRNFIGIEKEWEYCEIANERIKQAKEIKINQYVVRDWYSIEQKCDITKGCMYVDKNTPTKVKDFYAKWYSVGYTPRFIRCPSCDCDIQKTWEKPSECKKCGQKLLWD